MRLKLQCKLIKPAIIPYNYNYQLQRIIYNLIHQSSPEFSDFLHNTGFIEANRPFKLFTFSKLFTDGTMSQYGFDNVTNFTLLFSTPVQQSYEHLVLGVFAKQEFTLYFSADHSVTAVISSVESLPEPEINDEMKFITLSPLVVSTSYELDGKPIQHFLDYMIPDERERFIANLRQNLLRKYRLVQKKEYGGDAGFQFSFDVDYILKRKGNIRKNIKFKKDKQTGFYSRIIGMEAPFTIKADPELIKVGYQCGFGEKNSAGFGMVEIVK